MKFLTNLLSSMLLLLIIPPSDNPNTSDRIVLTKFDTIDDKVGSAISKTHFSRQPILFMDTGQTYTDLKSISSRVDFILHNIVLIQSVQAVVTALMK